MSPRQARFIAEYAVDGNAAAAARRAGYSPRSSRVNGPRLLSNAAVREALHVSQQAEAERLQLDRQQVLNGLMEAVEIARAKADAHALIRAWSEIGKMCGFYAPERKTVEVSVASRRVIDKLESMSDEELLVLAEGSLVTQ
jgi:hypothetical protein